MKILAISEFSQRGSGYTTIMRGMLREWERRLHEVVVLGFDYSGFEHDFKAPVIPTDPNRIQAQTTMVSMGFRPDIIVVIFDLSIHHALRQLQQSGIPYVGVFAIEADPLVHPSDWSSTIDTMAVAFCISEFGTDLLTNVGIRATHLRLGIDDFWRRPTPEERADARKRWNLDGFVVFTVADNQERKNLPAHAAAISLLAGNEITWPAEMGQRQKPFKDDRFNVRWVLNTKRRPRQAGYTLNDLLDRFKIADRTLVLEHQVNEGLDDERLRELYWASDAFLLLSKAEGFGLPVLEAMACGVPVVGTDCTGIKEQLGSARGQLVKPEYVHIDPFHNQFRRWADPIEAAKLLAFIAKGEGRRLAEHAHEYARARTWAVAGDIFQETLHEYQDAQKERSAAERAPASAIAEHA